MIETEDGGVSGEGTAANWFRDARSGIAFTHVGWALIGLIAFLIGTVVQSLPAKYPELTALVEQCQTTPAECGAAVRTFDVQAHRSSGLTLPMVIGDLLRSIGASIFISILIILTVEARSRREFDKLLTAKARELGMNVFHGMFNRDHPVALLDAVKQQILERDLIREHVDVAYTLSVIEGPTCGEGPAERLIKVDVILSSSTRNVSTLHGEAGRARMPLALLLPNPQIPTLKNAVQVTRFVVGGEDRSADDIARANEKLQAALADDNNNDALADFGTRDLEPGESLSLSATYTMIKELEDTEVFRTLQICQSLSLTVIDQTGLDLHIQAKSIHPGKLQAIGSSSATLQWRLPEIILPQQGIMVFWKRRRQAVP